MKKVVIYPGRFQPMLPHHAEVYKKLQATFPDADVYISTSDKVDGGKSPFNFKEKAEIMSQLHDIPTDKIILAPQPYLVDSYKQFNMQDSMVIFAVGEKDTKRFPMNNIDDKSGLDMTVRGEPRPKYYQMINTLKQHPALPMGERGYIYMAPNIGAEGEVASASAFRQAFTSVGSEQQQKQVFEKYLGTYNEAIFALFKNKILGDNMKEELDRLRLLAGMESLIEAPINFDDENDEVDSGDDYDSKPGFSQDNMINQLGKVIDSKSAGDDAEAMKIKNFKPVTSVTTDDGETVQVSPAQATALKDMFGMLSSARQGEEKSARERFNATIQTTRGLEQMLDFAQSKGLVKEESNVPQLDLGGIRDDYAVEEGDLEEGRVKDVLIDAQQMSKEEFDAKYKGEWDYAEILADYPVDEETTNMEADDEKVEINHDMMAHLANSSSEESTMFDDAMEIHDNEGEQALAQHLGMSDDEFNQELNEYCMARGLHADDDREEAIQGMVEELIDHREQMSSMRNAPQAQEESAETCDSCGKPVQLCGCDDHQHESIERLRQLAGI
tara:strand:+ start:299 stop:1966 length:1668 start_codon:yes stop_codon:yes gene_type:complete